MTSAYSFSAPTATILPLVVAAELTEAVLLLQPASAREAKAVMAISNAPLLKPARFI
jgi:hypothetical protein